MNEVTKNVKDAAYVLVGIGVVGFQQAQAQSEALRKRLDARRVEIDKQLAETRARIAEFGKDIENRLEPVQKQVREQVQDRVATIRGRFTNMAAA